MIPRNAERFEKVKLWFQEISFRYKLDLRIQEYSSHNFAPHSNSRNGKSLRMPFSLIFRACLNIQDDLNTSTDIICSFSLQQNCRTFKWCEISAVLEFCHSRTCSCTGPNKQQCGHCHSIQLQWRKD